MIPRRLCRLLFGHSWVYRSEFVDNPDGTARLRLAYGARCSTCHHEWTWPSVTPS